MSTSIIFQKKEKTQNSKRAGGANEKTQRLNSLREKYPLLRWGIELEVAGQHGWISKHLSNAPTLPTRVVGNLELGRDTSPEGGGGPMLKSNRRVDVYGRGYEFRTITPWEEFPILEINYIVELLKTQEIWINELCGMHIHFSGVQMTLAQVQLLRAKLLKHRQGIWRARRHYCTDEKDLTEHYSAVSVRRMVCSGDSLIITVNTPKSRIALYNTADWLEVRVFNMSSSFRGIYQSWQRVINALYEIMFNT